MQEGFYYSMCVFKEVEREAARLAASLEVRAADGQSLAGSLRLKEAELQHIRDSLKACAWTRLIIDFRGLICLLT